MSDQNQPAQAPLGIRIAQLVLAVIELALLAFLLAETQGGVFSAEPWALLCCIVTLIVTVYNIVSVRSMRNLYSMWAILSLDILLVIFWLSAMGSLAALRSAFNIPVNIYGRSLFPRYIIYGAWATDSYLAILAVTAAIGAIEFILFIVSLILVSIRIHRARAANTPRSIDDDTPEKIEEGSVEQTHEMNQMQAQQPPQFIPVQQPPQQFIPVQQMQQPPQQFIPVQQMQQPQFQQQQQQPQFQQQAAFTPVSPMQNPAQPYHPAGTPPPQQQYPTPSHTPAPQYAVQPPPAGMVEAPAAEYRGAA